MLYVAKVKKRMEVRNCVYASDWPLAVTVCERLEFPSFSKLVGQESLFNKGQDTAL